MWLSRSPPAHRANGARREVEEREVTATSTLLSLSSHWLLYAVYGNSGETEVHWNFKGLFKAGLEMRSHSSLPKAYQQTRISMQTTQLLICLHLGSMPGSAYVPASVLPVLSQRKDPGGIDSSCPTVTLWHVTHDPQRQKFSAFQQALSPDRSGLYMQHWPAQQCWCTLAHYQRR